MDWFTNYFRLKNMLNLSEKEEYIEKQNFRDIHQDILRCSLLYLTIQMKRFLLQIIQMPVSEVEPDLTQRVSNLILKHMKFLKFGIDMLNP